MGHLSLLSNSLISATVQSEASVTSSIGELDSKASQAPQGRRGVESKSVDGRRKGQLIIGNGSSVPSPFPSSALHSWINLWNQTEWWGEERDRKLRSTDTRWGREEEQEEEEEEEGLSCSS